MHHLALFPILIALAYGSNYLHTFLLILRDPIDRAFSHCIDAELRLAYMIDSTLHNVTALERYEALYKGFDKHGFAHCSCLLVYNAAQQAGAGMYDPLLCC